MKLTGHIITLLLFTANLLAAQSYGAQGGVSYVDEHKVFYKFDKTDIDYSYKGNAQSLAALRKSLSQSENIDSVCIYAYSNPEGSSAHNIRLAGLRAESLKRYILENMPYGLTSSQIKAYGMGENWDGLKKVITESYRRYDKQNVLRILNNTGISDDTRKWRLGKMDEGYTWVYLRKVYMADLKYAQICIYGRRPEPVVEPTEPTAEPLVGSVAEPVVEPVADQVVPVAQPVVESTVTDTLYTVVGVIPSGGVTVVPADTLVVSETPVISTTPVIPSTPVVPAVVDKVIIADEVVKPQETVVVVAEPVAEPLVETADTLFISSADSLFFDEPQQQEVREPITTLVKDEPEEKTEEEQPEDTLAVDESQRTVLGLKTNLLLDAVSALNFAVEVPFGKHFSVEYFQTTPWWEAKSNKFCLQFLSFGGQAKWWFLPRVKPATEDRKQRDALMGHFLGLYGWGGKGDLQLGRKVCQQFDFWSAGLTYGYSMAVSKNLNMEFSISVGYANILYQHYVPTDDFSILIKDNNLAGTLHYIGPTKAEISLVIPIRAKIKKKGGDR